MSDYQNANQASSDDAQSHESAKNDPLNQFLRHQQRAVEETGKALESLLPPDFRTHSKEAGREFVSGMKVLFDAAVSGLEQASKDFDKNFNRTRSQEDGEDRPSSTGATKVKVQVD
jgi:hypothetical protein